MIDQTWLKTQTANHRPLHDDVAVNRVQALLTERAAGFASVRTGVESSSFAWPRRRLGGDECAALLRAVDAGLAHVDDAGFVALPTVRQKAPAGRYSLFSRSGSGVAVNLEYVVQIGATAELVLDHRWLADAIEFERGEFDALGNRNGRRVLAMEAKVRATGPDSLHGMLSSWLKMLADPSLDRRTKAGRKLDELTRLCSAGPVVVWLVADSARWALSARLIDGVLTLEPAGPPAYSPGRPLRKVNSVNESFPNDAAYDRPGTVAADRVCSQHGRAAVAGGACAGEPVVSFRDRNGRRQSGCELALRQLVERGEISPLH
jgi:hypothetical protein